MRVKVGSKWYDVMPSNPIMVELTEKDKENIANMVGTKYAVFDNEGIYTWSEDDMKKWMAN